MRVAIRVATFVCMSLAAVRGFGPSEEVVKEVNQPAWTAEPQQFKVAVIPCKGLIDEGLYKSIRRRTELALGDGAKYILYDISTYGGLVKAADDISKYFILELGNKVHTVAYISTEAISAGAMISVSCEDVIMRRSTLIGDAAPVLMGGKLEGVEREKNEAYIRETFARAAEAHGYPEMLLKAMVTHTLKVYRVKNLKSGKYEFIDADVLPSDSNEYDLANKELVSKEGQLLTLTAGKALEYGIARAVVENIEEALAFLAERDGVVFAGKPLTYETNWSEEMVRWLNSPVVMSILTMAALLALYIEFNTPGIGLPGLIAVTCFVIMFGSKYLVGLANWVEIAVFLLGIILLMIEIFITPGFGVLGLAGIICICAGLFGMLIENPPEKLPWPKAVIEWEILVDGLLAISAGFLGFVVVAWVFAKHLPRLSFLKGLALAAAAGGGKLPVSMTLPPEAVKAGRGLEIGEVGEVISALRPVGQARFGEAYVDVVAHAEFIAKGQKVEITEIHGNRVVVKAVQG
ncbi:MAG: NfeD family protein [Planctomycetota bacterium]